MPLRRITLPLSMNGSADVEDISKTVMYDAVYPVIQVR